MDHCVLCVREWQVHEEKQRATGAHLKVLDHVTRAGPQGTEVDDAPAALHQQHLVEALQVAGCSASLVCLHHVLLAMCSNDQMKYSYQWEQTHCHPRHRTSKMSMEGWWMVHTTVRPVSTVLRTARITMAAARASRPIKCDPTDAQEGIWLMLVRVP